MLFLYKIHFHIHIDCVVSNFWVNIGNIYKHRIDIHKNSKQGCGKRLQKFLINRKQPFIILVTYIKPVLVFEGTETLL